MKEVRFEISEGTYIRITKPGFLIGLNVVGRNVGTTLMLERTEAQRLIEEMSRILEGEE